MMMMMMMMMIVEEEDDVTGISPNKEEEGLPYHH